MNWSKTLYLGFIILMMNLGLTGCTTPEQKAQELYSQNKYEELIAKYPDLPIATQAREKLAEQLLLNGKYAQLLALYPASPFAAQATDSLAMELFKNGKYDELFALYPESPAAAQAREKLAAEALTKALQLTDPDSRKELLLKITIDHANTSAAQQAQLLLDHPLSVTSSDNKIPKSNPGKSSINKLNP